MMLTEETSCEVHGHSSYNLCNFSVTKIILKLKVFKIFLNWKLKIIRYLKNYLKNYKDTNSERKIIVRAIEDLNIMSSVQQMCSRKGKEKIERKQLSN